MSCITGSCNTIMLSSDGDVYSFGLNQYGELGHNVKELTFPTLIQNLPRIKQISCGANFSVCVDYDGLMWSFGRNHYGQLGTGDKKNYNSPQQIQEIPPVHSVSCGGQHTLIIMENFDLWSVGENSNGQLCLGNKIMHSKPIKTSYSDIIKISASYQISLFQNMKGIIYGCGNNSQGYIGLGHNNHPQLEPCILPDQPSHIIEFCSGYYYSLFLDDFGNVYSVGKNECGNLGLGHYKNMNKITQIPNIPPMKSISCSSASSYLLDFEGNVWSFGQNGTGKLGHDTTSNSNFPKKISLLKDIQYISFGISGSHFFAKDSQNKIFGMGRNFEYQITNSMMENLLIPQEINASFFPLWGTTQVTRAKSARK